MATNRTKGPLQLAEDVTLTVSFRADGTVEIPLDEVLHRAGSSRERFDKTAKLPLNQHEDRAGLWLTDLEGAVAWIDAERTRIEEHRSRWQAYVEYRERKKREAHEARVEAARAAREQEQEANRRRWRKFDEERQRKAEQEAAQAAAQRADLEGAPVPFDRFNERAAS